MNNSFCLGCGAKLRREKQDLCLGCIIMIVDKKVDVEEVIKELKKEKE